MTIVSLAPVKAATVDVLAEHLVDVYEHASPASVDTSRPYIVVQWPPGGGPIGSAARQNQRWELAVRILAVAVSPDPSSTPPQAAADAATAIADAARQVLLNPRIAIIGGDGSQVTGRGFTAAAGVEMAGNTVNVVDDYLLTVTAAC